jgi:NTP pyrophosphatase (non-canonical NTP hydrolase)
MVNWSDSEPSSDDGGMKLNELMHATRETAAYRAGTRSLLECMHLLSDASQLQLFDLVYLTTKLASEAGEVAGVMGKFFRGDTTYEVAKDRLAKETQDVLWYVVRIFDDLDLDAEDEARKLMARLVDRKARGVIRGDGDDR